MRKKAKAKAGVEKSASAPSFNVGWFEGIAILGSHPATVGMAPFNDKWKIYACSPHNFEQRRLPRIDEWFEVHKPIADSTRAYPYLKYVETLPFVWMRDEDAMPHFPGARRYPEKEMKERFGPFCFTSTIAYMIARAIVDCEENDIPAIGLFGVMQSHPNEYAYQRPGIQNLIWEATRPDREKFGLKRLSVIAPDISRLFEPQPDQF